MPGSVRVLVPLAPGFEEIEAVTIIDVLRRASLEVKAAALDKSPIKGAHGIRLEADLFFSADLGESEWDAIVLPGGMPGAEHLRDSEPLRALLKAQAESGRIVAAICAAPIALEAAGVLEGRRATCYPGFEEQLASATLVKGAVVEDGPIITSRGPGTALPFALALVKRLVSAEAADELAAGMLVG